MRSTQGAAMVNVAGSFHDFRAELYRGTATDPLVAVARVLDRIHDR